MANKQAVESSFGCVEFGRSVTDPKQAEEMVKLVMDFGCFDFDTANLYSEGKTEKMMGNIEILQDPKVYIATKAHPWSEKGLQYDCVIEQLNTSLERLKRKSVDLFYLHVPDHNTPVEETLKAVNQLHKEGKFKEFGLSNYASWEVAEIYFICKNNNYVLPTVYQGMYNALTRDVEKELFPCLRRFGMRFYAYNPLAGGLLTGKYKYSDKDTMTTGRFFDKNFKGTNMYQGYFWHKANFDTLEKLKVKLDERYGKGSVSVTEASLRWLYHHSKLSGKCGDKVIIGASSSNHVEQNMKASKQESLHEDIVNVFDEGWSAVKGICPDYRR